MFSGPLVSYQELDTEDTHKHTTAHCIALAIYYWNALKNEFSWKLEVFLSPISLFAIANMMVPLTDQLHYTTAFGIPWGWRY